MFISYACRSGYFHKICDVLKYLIRRIRLEIRQTLHRVYSDTVVLALHHEWRYWGKVHVAHIFLCMLNINAG